MFSCRQSRRTTIAIATAALLLASGCGTLELPAPSPSGPMSPVTTTPPAPPRGPDFAVATYDTTELGGDAAALEGRVRIRDGCLYVLPVRSRRFILPIFPAGRLRLTDEGLFFNSTLLREGELILLGGGGRKSVPTNAQIPAECTDTRRPFQVANN